MGMTKDERTSGFENHVLEIARIAKKTGEVLDLKADAQQACFATIMIAAGNQGIFFAIANPELPPNGHSEAVTKDAAAAAKADAQIQDAPRNPTPEQAEAGAMTALKDGVRKACRLLNAEGYMPPLRPATLDAYIKNETDLGKPFAEFDSEDMEALIKNLSFKLTELQEKKKSNESKAGF